MYAYILLMDNNNIIIVAEPINSTLKINTIIMLLLVIHTAPNIVCHLNVHVL